MIDRTKPLSDGGTYGSTPRVLEHWADDLSAGNPLSFGWCNRKSYQ